MAQADGKTKLQRIQLRFVESDGTTYTYGFRINPESYTETFPQRTNSFKARSAVIIEDFGPDTPTIKFSGTTGYGKLGTGKSGAQRMEQLKSLLSKYAKSGHKIGDAEYKNMEMYFYNHTDGGAYAVHLAPEGYEISRSADKSLLYQYNISLLVLRNANEANPRLTKNASVNKNPSSGLGNVNNAKKQLGQSVNYKGERLQ